MKTLIFGDENLTFTPCFLDNFPNCKVDVAVCLPADKLQVEARTVTAKLQSRGVGIHFGVNPALLRQHFTSEVYDRLLFVLPGLAFQGCPNIVDKQRDPLFKLRLQLYIFGFMKSSRQAIRDDGLLQILWVNQEMPMAPDLPWQPVDLDKLGPFCKVRRSEEDDILLETSYYHNWSVLIHDVPYPTIPDYLKHSKFYSWRMTYDDGASARAKLEAEAMSEGLSREDRLAKEDMNILRIPPSIFEYSREQLPHVNELFRYELRTNTGELFLVSKLTVKYDPRISGWKNDGSPAKRAHVAPVRTQAAPPPPPPSDSAAPPVVPVEDVIDDLWWIGSTLGYGAPWSRSKEDDYDVDGYFGLHSRKVVDSEAQDSPQDDEDIPVPEQDVAPPPVLTSTTLRKALRDARAKCYEPHPPCMVPSLVEEWSGY